MKFLIVGFGSIGRRHYQNLIALGYDDVIFLRSGNSTIDDVLIKPGQVVGNLEAALAFQPDAAIIATPTGKHMETALPLAAQGVHLLIEKPVSHEIEGTQALLQTARRAKSRVLVGYQFRFHPALKFIKRALHEGAVGIPLSARARWGEYLPNWHPWEDFRSAYSARSDLGGGVILTLSHPIDYLRWLFGEARSVSALVSAQSHLGLDVDELAELIVHFQDDLIASIHLDYHRRPALHDLEIMGTEGCLTLDFHGGAVLRHSIEGKAEEIFASSAAFERNTMFMDELAHFIELIRDDIRAECDLEDGIETLKLCLAALDSARLGERVDV